MEDISLFSTATSLEELELFNSFSLTGENEFALDYDVYSCIEETKPPVTNLLAEDLLQEFDFEGWFHSPFGLSCKDSIVRILWA